MVTSRNNLCAHFGGGIMGWGGITAHGKTDLVIVDGNLNSRDISIYRRDIATSGCSLRPEHGARGIVPGSQCPTPSSQDRGRVPAAGTNHEGGLAGLLTGLKPY